MRDLSVTRHRYRDPVHCRRFKTDLDRQRHHLLMPRLAEAGLAPQIIRMDDEEICLKKYDRFDLWWRSASPGELLEMRASVLHLIEGVHALGVCHRDLHERNLVLDGGIALVIDLELACEVNPAWRCYDLYGPSESIPVAEQHVAVNDGHHSVHGVWWDSPVSGLHLVFGPLQKPEEGSSHGGVVRPLLSTS